MFEPSLAMYMRCLVYHPLNVSVTLIVCLQIIIIIVVIIIIISYVVWICATLLWCHNQRAKCN